MAGVLLGVDALTGEWGALSALLTEALDTAGFAPEEVTHHERAGDGVRYVLPADRLGAVVDLADHLDQLAARHNKWHPDHAVRLCIAVDLGESPVRLDRLLRCPLIARAAVHSGLVLSGAAHRALGDRTDFAEVEISGTERAWVRVPGVDATALAELAGEPADEQAPMHVVNTINGYAENVIQAGIVRGGVYFGERRR
jgi:hypothetical protein